MPWMYNSLHLYPYISKFKIALVQIIWPLSGIIVVLNEHKFNLDWYQNKYNINIKNYYNSSVPKYILVKILTQFFIQRGSQNYQYYFKYLVRLFSYHLTILQSPSTKLLRKPINGLYHFKWLVVIDLSMLDKNGSINGLQNNMIR